VREKQSSREDVLKSLSKSQLLLFLGGAEIDRLTLKFTWKCRGPRIAKTILKKQVGGLYFLISKFITKLQ